MRSYLLIGILIIQTLVNLVGALGPELGFDALWYHLTIPRIWLAAHRIYFIADPRYYYSVQPKLVDTLFLPALALGNEIWTKLMHFGFSIVTLVVIYKLARKWLKREYSLLACLIFLSNLVVNWQATTAYIDLSRTFFEVLALYCLIDKKICKCGLVLGLAIATKLVAFGSLPIFVILLVLQKASLKNIIVFILLCFIPVLPWLVFAFISTGNPIYPVFSGYDASSVRHLTDFITVFTRSADPLSPIYLMLLPLIIYYHKRLPGMLIVYCGLGLVIWWLTPRTGGGRFILPYLPVFSVLAATTIFNISIPIFKKIAIGITILLAFISIGYRAIANAKFVPVILGQQTKQDFLNKNLNKNFGDNNFYMSDPLQK